MTTTQLMIRRGELVNRYASYMRQRKFKAALLVNAELRAVTTTIIKRELRNEKRAAA